MLWYFKFITGWEFEMGETGLDKTGWESQFLKWLYLSKSYGILNSLLDKNF